MAPIKKPKKPAANATKSAAVPGKARGKKVAKKKAPKADKK